MSGVLQRMVDAFVGTAPRSVIALQTQAGARVQLQEKHQSDSLSEDQVVQRIGQMTPETQYQMIADVTRRMPELRERKLGEVNVGIR